MDNKQIKNDAITRRSEDFAQWYTDICKKAELMDYSSVKGFIIYRPYGYAIWEEIQNYLNKRFKESGHQNVYMPTVIPESLFNKEKEHVSGFAPETLICTIGGQSELDDRLIVRPTSEVLFCEHYAKVISSYRDLPKLYNQWCSVVRWEKTTRPFLRGAEFLWQEGHTMHETEEEARTETLKMLEVYDDLGRDLLAVPFIKGRKTEKEKFAGAVETYTIEALMPDGKALQSGTTHYFGDGFAKAFGVQFQGRDGKLTSPHQTSWGVSTRLLGAIIMVHGDDNGLVLPPRVAPIQAVVIPVAANRPGVIPAARELYDELNKTGLRVKIDESDRSPGWKFSEYEMKGVPVRIEIGPRDIENGVVTIAKRNDSTKIQVKREELAKTVVELMETIHQEMYEKAYRYLLDHVTEVHTLEELDAALEKGGYAKMMWCEDEACEDFIKKTRAATARCMPFNQTKFDEVYPVCGKKATKVVLFAKAY
ncbi:MAG: proline--tRNA ligase [Bacilli bacterium]|nr:proline--tRNA ligase [Bacilli bacterium]